MKSKNKETQKENNNFIQEEIHEEESPLKKKKISTNEKVRNMLGKMGWKGQGIYDKLI